MEWCENCSGIGEQFPTVICQVCKGTGFSTDDPDLIGECDTCDALYDVSSRDGRCGDCGECSTHCPHV